MKTETINDKTDYVNEKENETTCQNNECEDFKVLIDNLKESSENIVYNQYIISLAINDLKELLTIFVSKLSNYKRICKMNLKARINNV